MTNISKVTTYTTNIIHKTSEYDWEAECRHDMFKGQVLENGVVIKETEWFLDEKEALNKADDLLIEEVVR